MMDSWSLEDIVAVSAALCDGGCRVSCRRRRGARMRMGRIRAGERRWQDDMV